MRKTLQRRLIKTIVAGFIAIVLLNLVVYYYHLNQINLEKLAEFNEYQVTQVRDEFERRIGAAQRDVLRLAFSDETFLDAVRAFDATYDQRTLIMDRMTALTAADHRIESVYLYLPAYGRVFSTQYGMFFDREQFYDPVALGVLDGAGFVSITMPRVFFHLQSSHEFVTMAARFPADEHDWTGLLVVNLNVAAVYRDLSQRFIVGDHILVVTDTDGEVMYPRLDADRSEALSSILEYRPPTFPRIPRFVVSSRTTRMYGAEFHVVIDLGAGSVVTGDLFRAVRVVFVLSALAVAVLLLYMFRVFAPLNALVERIRAEGGDDVGAGDIEYLNRYLSTMHTDNAELKSQYDEMFPMYRRKFMQDVLLGLVADSTELDEQLAYHDVRLAGDTFIALCIDLSREQINDREFGVFRVYIQSLVGTAIGKSFSGYCVETTHSRFGVALGVTGFTNSDVDHARVCAFAEATISSIGEAGLRDRVLVGVGRFVTDRGELHRSYEEAENALQYRSLADRHVVSVYHAKKSRTPYTYPYSTERKLFNLIRAGSAAEAVRTVTEIFADARAQGFSEHELTHVSSQLLHSLNRFVFDHGVEIGGSHRPADLIVYEPHRIDEAIRYLADVVRRICDAGVHGDGDGARDAVAEILEFIGANSSEKTLQLADLEQKFSLNRYYIGHLIKDRTGLSFSDYLHRKRVAVAEDLLRETRRSVKDIGFEVGYSYTYYFIRTFKKIHGVTPNEFRRIHAR